MQTDLVAVPPPGWSAADLHVHTNMSDGTDSPSAIALAAVQRGLPVIAVTDHDTLEGAQRASDFCAQHALPLAVIIGTEVTSRHGHIIGLFLHQRIKAMKSAEYTIETIKEQGGICIIAHPFRRLVPSLSRRKIAFLFQHGYAIDGIELYNPASTTAKMRAAAALYNQEWGFAAIGGSDTHYQQQLGNGYTLFPGTSAQDLRQAILDHTTRSGGRQQDMHVAWLAQIERYTRSLLLDPPRRLLQMFH